MRAAAVLEESAATSYDPRPLAERLAEARAAKREAVEEQLRFSTPGTPCTPGASVDTSDKR